MKTKSLKKTSDAIELLKNGEIVALPTETVYGLAGNAFEAGIVKKIFEAKDRPSFDPLIVHISDSYLEERNSIEKLIFDEIIDPSVFRWKNRAEIDSLMNKFWPGPLTIILPKGSKIPNEVTSNQNTVGIRCPNHPLFQKVLHELSFPLAAPSANRFGRISPTKAEHVIKELDGKIAGVLDGGSCSVGVESTIIQITENSTTLLRPGKISKSEIENTLGMQISNAPSLMESESKIQLAPGMLDEHYAPRKPLYLLPFPFTDPRAVQSLSQFPEFNNPKSSFMGMSSLPAHLQHTAKQMSCILSAENVYEEMAKKLFSTLRELDESEEVSVIFVDSPSDTKEGLGASIFDRLKRASRNKPSTTY